MELNPKTFKAGDILLFKPKAITEVSGWFITWAENVVGKNPLQGQTKIGYCHIAIVDENTNFILEAKWPKTRRWQIDWDKLNKNYDVELWRIKKITKKQIEGVLQWCYQHIGEWYDIPSFLWGWFDVKHAEVCSTFVQKAFASIGIDFQQSKKIGDGKLISPDEIAASNLIYKV